ncbi:MAG: VWA domain-containing protein [Spirochaetales bacterium]|nr:MAG: VWA domain-containing protein [Spirochaetales bacterium]
MDSAGRKTVRGSVLALASDYENLVLEPVLKEFEKRYKVNVSITYMGPADLVRELGKGSTEYAAFWPADSLWFSLADKTGAVTHAASIMTSPVIFGIKKSIADTLGFTGRKVYAADLLKAIKEQQLQFIMPSPVQTTAGACAYAGLLTALADDLSRESLHSGILRNTMREFFQGVSRSAGSGSSGWLTELFLRADYGALVSTEGALIELNNGLLTQGREPLHLVYPEDSLLFADFPLGFIGSPGSGTEAAFLSLQQYLLSPKVQQKIRELGRRSPAGEIPGNMDDTVFNPAWGIRSDLSSSTQRPPADILKEALTLYQTEFKKPSFTVFCLDFSGSMKGKPAEMLKQAMVSLFGQERAHTFITPAGDNDITVIFPYNERLLDRWFTIGNNPLESADLLQKIGALSPSGQADMLPPVLEGLALMAETPTIGEYLPSLILITGGSGGTIDAYRDLQTLRNRYNIDIPVFSIAVGEAETEQLEQFSLLTNGRTFDGRKDLSYTLQRAKGYN